MALIHWKQFKSNSDFCYVHLHLTQLKWRVNQKWNHILTFTHVDAWHFASLKKSHSAIRVRDAVISCWFLPHAWLGSDLVQAFKKGEPLIVLDTQKRGPFFCIRGTLPQGYTHAHTDDPPLTHTPDTPYTHTHTHAVHTHRDMVYTHTDKQPLMLLTHFHEKLVPLVGLPQSLLHWQHHRGGGGGHAKTRIAETHNTS